MTRMTDVIPARPDDRPRFITYGILTLGSAGLAAVLSVAQGALSRPYLGRIPAAPVGFFQPFFGGIPPLLAVLSAAVLGAGSLRFLRARHGFAIDPKPGHRGRAVATLAATLFGVEAIIVEMTGIARQPADMNVPPPWSLLFYPVIAFVVEVVFHAAPLALLLAAMGPLFKRLGARSPVWPSILVVALIEPLVQIGLSGSPRSPVADAYVGLQVLSINLVQLSIFRRYDFFSMYAMRFNYYVIWHIIWGYWRLPLLF